MAAILHYMSYPEIMGDSQLTIKRLKIYTKRRDMVLLSYKVCMTIFLISLQSASYIRICFQYDKDIGAYMNAESGKDKYISNIYQFSIISVRLLIAVIFCAAIIRMAMARQNVKKRGQEHLIPLPKFCQFSTLALLFAILLTVASLLAYFIETLMDQ